jgi:DNA-binding beta-propeller fold protein YncE
MTYLRIALIGLSAIGTVSCAPVPQVEQAEVRGQIVFPPPPERARFVFERTIRGSADIVAVDKETRWRRLLTGEAVSSVVPSKPFDVTVCQGRIYVSDTVRRSVFLFDMPGGEFAEIGLTEPGQLHKPLGVATDGECNLYVADGTARRVVVYDQDGQYLSAIGGVEMFDRLSHVEVDPSGERVYTVDTGGVGSNRHHVRVFAASSGEHLHDIGRRGNATGELNLPRDLALGPDGNLYIVDGGNFRVQVFDRDGNFIRRIGTIGTRTGQFSRPKGIDTDNDGNVYVSDAAFGNFQIFNSQGELLLFVGDRSESPEPAKFMLPAGLAVDEDGRVYMVDQFFRKIDVFRPASMRADDGYLGSRRYASR